VKAIDRRALTHGLMRALGPDSSRSRLAAAAGITAAQYALAWLKAPPRNAQLEGTADEWLRAVRARGYCVVPDYYDAETCRRAIAELERLFAAHPECVHRKSDVRIFGVEAGSPLLQRFGDDARLQQVARCVLREPAANAFTLGARIDYAPGNKGSGEGWHRDSFVVQFKAILYLCDVERSTGPFELIADSEKLPRLLADMREGRLGLQQNRIADAQVERLLQRDPSRLRTFTGRAGTLLLVNTSAIHRGRPIERGSRYALTAYFTQSRRIGPAMDAHFAPVLRSGREAPTR
jgi:hypothetical protein